MNQPQTRFKLRLLAGSALLPLLCAPAFAQTQSPQPMDNVVVTATRLPQKVSDTILDTTVITAQDIRDSQAVDVPSLLRREAGFEFVQTGGIGSNSSTFLRGTNSTHVLVLIDGVRINSATSGAPALDQLMLDQVERIEIVRGSVSSVYGSEAIGGVIQIFTKRGHGTPAFSASAGFGNRNTHRVGGSYGGEINDTQFNVTVSDFSTGGFPAIKPSVSPTVNPNNDGYRNTSVAASVSQRFSPQFRAGASLYFSDGHVDYANAFAFSASDAYAAHNQIGTYSVFGEFQVMQNWISKLTLSRGQDHSTNTVNGAFDSKFDTNTDQASWENNFKVASGQSIAAGVETRRQSVSSDTAYTTSARNVSGIFAGYTGEFNQVSVQGNVRSEHYSDFGSTTTYLAGAGYRLSNAWRVSAAAGSAFRAPDYNELYYPGFGNPLLKPERAHSAEVGLQYAQGSQLAKLAIFRTRITDLIGGFPIANINHAEITGAELSYRGQWYGIDVIASFTAQNPVDQSNNNQQLLRRAHDYGALSLQKLIGPWRLGGEITGAGTRYDNNPTAFPTVRDTLGGYTVVNFTARYQINRMFAVQAKVENAFDRDYQVADGYNTPPRTYFVGITYQQ